MTLPKCIIDMMETRTIFKNDLRTSEAQLVPKLKNNEPQPEFTAGSYKKNFKKRVEHP